MLEQVAQFEWQVAHNFYGVSTITRGVMQLAAVMHVESVVLR